jgi:hypothetical protein
MVCWCLNGTAAKQARRAQLLPPVWGGREKSNLTGLCLALGGGFSNGGANSKFAGVKNVFRLILQWFFVCWIFLDSLSRPFPCSFLSSGGIFRH